MRLRTSITGTLLATGLAIGLGVGAAGPASALSQITGPFQCGTNTYVKITSRTTGYTTHSASDGQSWYKGTFSGTTTSTSNTKRSVLTYVQVNASTISSSGGACV
jgi:hypothetical protein